MIDRIRIGTRGSRLALWQANHVKSLLEAAWPGLFVSIVEIHTRGDRDQATSLTATGGIGFFTKEIEQALINERVDLAVHSLKDLPTVLVPGLTLGAVPEREDTRDALIGRPGRVDGTVDLTPGTRVGTSSPRRQGQLLAACPGIACERIRGNVPTRIAKVSEDGGPDATILALAGLKRLALTDAVTEILPLETMLPAAGQGALGLEVREDDAGAREVLAALEDPAARAAVTAERAFLHRLEGGCSIPAGALGEVVDGRLVLDGVVADVDGGGLCRARVEGDPADAGALGGELAEVLLSLGAGKILARLRSDEP
ncbi:MAG: hydroxymethylbilane synthase [Planctomycetota bacterium]